MIHHFRLPASHCTVRAVSKADAIAILRRNCYPGAPVEEWPHYETPAPRGTKET